jgi:hypothetical protein
VALAKKVKRITPNKYRLVDSYKIKCSSYLLEYTLRDKNSFTHPSPGNSREGQTHTQHLDGNEVRRRVFQIALDITVAESEPCAKKFLETVKAKVEQVIDEPWVSRFCNIDKSNALRIAFDYVFRNTKMGVCTFHAHRAIQTQVLKIVPQSTLVNAHSFNFRISKLGLQIIDAFKLVKLSRDDEELLSLLHKRPCGSCMPRLADHQTVYFKVEGSWFRFDDMTNTRARVTCLPLNNEREFVVVLIYAWFWKASKHTEELEPVACHLELEQEMIALILHVHTLYRANIHMANAKDRKATWHQFSTSSFLTWRSNANLWVSIISQRQHRIYWSILRNVPPWKCVHLPKHQWGSLMDLDGKTAAI